MDKQNKPVKFKLRVDIQCGVCGSLTHFAGNLGGGDPRAAAVAPPGMPKFCACCGGAMERFCLKCHKKADMYFEEWWPEDDECLRTYSPAKRCPSCNARLELESDDRHPHHEHD